MKGRNTPTAWAFCYLHDIKRYFAPGLACRETDSSRPVIFYWRTSSGEEVDFVIELQSRLLAVEVKATTNPGYNDSKGLRSFLQEYGKTALGALRGAG